MFLMMVLYYCVQLFGLYPSSLCFATITFRGMVLPLSSGEPTLLGPVDRASLYRWTLSTKYAGHTYIYNIWPHSYFLIVSFEALISYLVLHKFCTSVEGYYNSNISLLFVTHSQIFTQLECMASVLSTQCPPIEANSTDRTQQSRFTWWQGINHPSKCCGCKT
jgi:hypothetical protein